MILLASPNLFGFAHLGGAAAWIPRIAGLIILLQAMMTDYELGLVKTVPISLHLMMDYVLGAILIAAPFVFGFYARSSASAAVCVIIGLLALGAAFMTQPRGRPRDVLV